MKRAFTLIELLVVIAIIAILAAILFPVFAQAKDSAKQSASLSNMKQIQTAVHIYGADYDDLGPHYLLYQTDPGYYLTWMDQMVPYVKNEQIWISPAANTTVGAYGIGCASSGANISKVVASYVWPAWNGYYDRWGAWFDGPPMGAGWPAAQGGYAGAFAGNMPFCNNTTGFACKNMLQSDLPAETGWLMEGVAISWFTTGTAQRNMRFGSMCNMGFTATPTNKTYFRHREGGNLAFADGHAAWKGAKTYLFDRSVDPAGTGLPRRNKWMRVVQ
jgi:prepilin-type N-terminal cleavage/methylation domain-containing protein/prepilin-type processing-associated H-X9-DG protein